MLSKDLKKTRNRLQAPAAVIKSSPLIQNDDVVCPSKQQKTLFTSVLFSLFLFRHTSTRPKIQHPDIFDIPHHPTTYCAHVPISSFFIKVSEPGESDAPANDSSAGIGRVAHVVHIVAHDCSVQCHRPAFYHFVSLVSV